MNQLAIQIQYDDRFAQALASAARAGYQHVAIGFGSSKCFHTSGWEKDVLYMERLLRENGLQCIQTHLPYYDLLISAEILDADMDTAMLRCVEASGRLGAAWCAYHARTAINDNYSPRKSMEYAKQALEPLVNAAAIHHTGIAVENLPVFPGMHFRRFFTSDYEDLCQLHDSFACKEMSICWDFGHAHLMNYDQALAIRTVGDRIQATHIHNNDQKRDNHFLPSQGSIDWPAVMKELQPFYRGALTLELVYDCNPYLDSFMAHSYDCVKYLKGILEAKGD